MKIFCSDLPYQKPFVFSVSAFSLQKCTLKLEKNWSYLCNFYSKVIFLEFLSKKIFCTSLC